MRTEISQIKDPVRRLVAFCRERHNIYVRRQRGLPPKEWTNDPVLRAYRFCNVYRELDKVTVWIAEHWRKPHYEDPDLWFAMCVARLLNQPESLQACGYPVPWDVYAWGSALKAYKKRGGKVFNAAYIVSTNGISIDKLAYLSHDVLTPMWKRREALRPKDGDSLNSYHMLLGQMQGFGSFMTAQVVADLKYVHPLSEASDWATFAASGPGSRRGLNLVLERSSRDPWREDDWRVELGRLREKISPLFEEVGLLVPHAQDLQNCLCEYSKYHRAVFDDKMPKQRYRT